MALVLFTAACSFLGDGSPAQQEPKASAEPALGGSVSLPGGGELYLVAGAKAGSADLYRVRHGTGIERLTHAAPGPGVGHVTAGGNEVILTAAFSSGGFATDKIYRVNGGGVELFIDRRVFSPTLSRDGRHLAYEALRSPDWRSPDSVFTLVVRDLHTGYERTVHETPLPLNGVDWTAGGSLAVIEKAANYLGGRVLIIDVDGTRRYHDLGVHSAGGIHSDGHRWLAVAAMDASDVPLTVLLDTVSGGRHQLEGWRPRAWSPDLSSLLVGNGPTLALVDPADPSRVTPVAELTLPIWGAAWVAGMDNPARQERGSAAFQSQGYRRVEHAGRR